jgi:hypothetical protein
LSTARWERLASAEDGNAMTISSKRWDAACKVRQSAACRRVLFTGSNGFHRPASAGSVLVAAGGSALTGSAR